MRVKQHITQVDELDTLIRTSSQRLDEGNVLRAREGEGSEMEMTHDLDAKDNSKSTEQQSDAMQRITHRTTSDAKVVETMKLFTCQFPSRS